MPNPFFEIKPELPGEAKSKSRKFFGLRLLKIKSRRSNVEVRRACQCVITVLTPATTRDGGSTNRLD
ncbi:MAG TPA: hypothetical protein VK400_06945 [Pyrinomonadaceae bacterium]|nr:hypothetical protein [Pyrinomonadaceae bacterium]